MWPGTRVGAESNADIFRGKHGLAHSAAFIWLLIRLTYRVIDVRNRFRRLAVWLEAPIWDVLDVANSSLLASPSAKIQDFHPQYHSFADFSSSPLNTVHAVTSELKLLILYITTVSEFRNFGSLARHGPQKPAPSVTS
jgi:hypothetical protein